MIVCNERAETGRPAWAAGVGAAQGPGGEDGGRAPLWVGFPGHGGLQTGVGKQGRASRSHCSTAVLWWQGRARGIRTVGAHYRGRICGLDHMKTISGGLEQTG